MQEFSPNRVWLQYRDNVTECMPIMGRMYTMTHSDETADLFVVVGKKIAADQIGEIRDEVILRWAKRKSQPVLYGEVLVDLEHDKTKAEFRNKIFTEEMPLALCAVRNADRLFFNAHPELDHAKVYISFKSNFHQYRRVVDYGEIGMYS